MNFFSSNSETHRPLSEPTSSSDESSANNAVHNMPRGGRFARGAERRQELDLSEILTFDQKNQLVQLINNILEGMNKSIRETFEGLGDNVDPKEEENIPPSGDKPDEAITPSAAKPGAGAAPPPAIPKTYEEATKVTAEEEQELLKLGVSELKKDLMTYFGKWRLTVSKRIGDITVAKNAGGQKPQQSRNNGKSPENDNKGNGAKAIDTNMSDSDSTSVELYRPFPTGLAGLPQEKRALILHSILLLLLSLEHYAAYSRVLLLHLASSLHVPAHILAEDEIRVAQGLSEVVKDLSAEEIAQKRAEEGKSSRRWKVGLAGAAGAALIGITGGLAAPLVAAGLGTVLGGIGLGGTAAAGLLGAMAESTVVVGTLFGVYGARAGGKMMDAYAKEIQDFAFLPLHGSSKKELIDPKDVPPEDRRLRLVLGISGWLAEKEDVVNPWRVLGHDSEVYALRMELEALLKMGNALETVVKSAAWGFAKKEIISRTIFASLMQAFWPIGLLKISKLIDNPWSVGMVRAEKAGYVLADVIMNKVQGERGITLIAYSLGARTVYSCLMALSEKRAFGLVENVVFIGAPCPSEMRVWAALKSVVAGRLVNVYSKNDYILGFLYRTSSWQFGVAGLQKIQGVPGVENLDVSDMVSGHLRYQHLVGTILKKLGWEDIDLKEVAKEEETIALLEEEEVKEEKRREERQFRDEELSKEAARLRQEVEEKNRKAELAETEEKMRRAKLSE